MTRSVLAGRVAVLTAAALIGAFGLAGTPALAGTPTAGSYPASYPYIDPSELFDLSPTSNPYYQPVGLGSPDGTSSFA